MAETEVIKEFLVSLGWSVNEEGMRRFAGAIGSATARAAALGVGVTAAALAVVAGVERMAEQFEQLYYASQRIHASAQNIAAFEFAARQIGLTAGDARAALEAFAAQLRVNPGTEGFLNSVGVQTRTAMGSVRDTTKVFQDFLDRLRNMPYSVAVQMAAMMGISERTLFQMLNNQEQLRKEQDRYSELANRLGVNMDDAAKASVEFMNRLRDLGGIIQLVAARWSIELLPVADKFVQVLTRIANIATDRLLGPLTAGLDHALTLLNAICDVLEGRWQRAWEAAKNVLPKWFGMFNQGELVHPPPGMEAPKLEYPRGKPSANQSLGDSIRNFFRRLGWSDAAATGITANLAQESSLRPDATGDSGRSFGIAQWGPVRQKAFKDWAGYDIRHASLIDQLMFINHELTEGADRGARAAGQALRGAQTPDQAAQLFSNLYERPADPIGEAARRGAIASEMVKRPIEHLLPPTAATGPRAEINQNTTITVQGADDPKATAREIAREQDRVNTAQRNLVGEALR